MERDAEERILSALGRIEGRLAALGELEHLRDRRGARPGSRDAAEPAAPRIARVPAGGNDEEDWFALPEAQVAAILAPFANEQRVKLLKALYLGLTESGQLKEFTGLTGGQLYHHLKELALARFLSREVRGEYRLSSFGYYAFSALMILAAELLGEEMDEELVGPEEIQPD